MRHALAQILGRTEVRDPGLVGVSVTVAEVRMSPDLRRATAFVTALGRDEIETVLAALTRARPYLRRQVGHAVRLRYTPELEFRADPSFSQAERIETLLKHPVVARDLEDGGEEEGGGA